MLTLDTEDKLSALYTGNVKESLHLEYKASDAIDKKDDRKKIEMACDVSAFANADGGQIVYGMTEVANEPAGLDAGVDPKEYPEIWFEAVLQQHVTPKLAGIDCKHVPLSNGRVAVVMSVPKAQGDPHQVSEGRYYRRHSYNRLRMEHHEIKDAFTRQSNPLLYVEARILEQHKKLVFQGAPSNSDPVTLQFFVGNRSNTPSMYTVLHFYIDAKLIVRSAGGFDAQPQSTEFKIFTRKLGIPYNFPIFKEQIVSLNEKSFNVEIPPIPRGKSEYYDLKVNIFSPGFSGTQQWRLRQLNDQLSMDEDHSQ